MSERLEKARQELAHVLFTYSGLGAICLADIRPQVSELEAAVWEEAMERAAQVTAMTAVVSQGAVDVATALRSLAKEPQR